MHVGWALGFDSKLLLEGLTNSLSKALKQLVEVKGSKTGSEFWRDQFHSWEKMQSVEENPGKSLKHHVEKLNQNPQYFR